MAGPGVLARLVGRLATRRYYSTIAMTGTTLDANTVYHLDKYSRSAVCTKNIYI